MNRNTRTDNDDDYGVIPETNKHCSCRPVRILGKLYETMGADGGDRIFVKLSDRLTRAEIAKLAGLDPKAPLRHLGLAFKVEKWADVPPMLLADEI